MLLMLDTVWYSTGMINTKNPHFTHDELKRALKKFKAQRDDVQQPVVLCCYQFSTIFIH